MEMRISNNLLNNKQDILISDIKNSINNLIKKQDDSNIRIENSSSFAILKVKNIVLSHDDMILYGVLLNNPISTKNSIFYGSYLKSNSHIIAYIKDKNEINRLKQQIIEKAETLTFDLSLAIAYVIDDSKVNNLSITNLMLEVTVGIKLYIAFFSKFKLRENLIAFIDSDNQSEKRIFQEVLSLLKLTVLDKDSIDDNSTAHCIDFILSFKEIKNEDKLTLIKLLNFGGYIIIEQGTFQLDPPEVQFLTKMNSCLCLFDIESFINSFTSMGLLINYLNDFIDKIRLIDDYDINSYNETSLSVIDLANIAISSLSYNDYNSSMEVKDDYLVLTVN